MDETVDAEETVVVALAASVSLFSTMNTSLKSSVRLSAPAKNGKAVST